MIQRALNALGFRAGVVDKVEPHQVRALESSFDAVDAEVNGLDKEAERIFEEVERNHDPGWDLKIFIREYVCLYVARFGTNRLPALQFNPEHYTETSPNLGAPVG